VAAFSTFARIIVASGVHSASGRTLPKDDASDTYPVPLTYDALSPGTVYSDPYGHVIVVAKWVPQGLGGSGMLIGADAQPDAAVGRRRFFRGNFLFTPNTDDVGAGFKAFRPIVRREGGNLVSLSNAELASDSEHPPASFTQYEGTSDDFYARMDALIYPRPVVVEERITQAVTSFEEQVVRRVDAIDVLEGYLTTHRGTIAMPEGYQIFETQGAWEDFATPSRDMRMLIAIDVVNALPDRVRATPERFGVAKSAGAKAADDARRRLDERLRAVTFSYTRSDGSKQTLTLLDVVQRAAALEMAYNPNDCPERRWGAPKDSPEAATCKRKAPEEQVQRMARYRDWFHARTRPPRP
jgi:hypothetical protein